MTGNRHIWEYLYNYIYTTRCQEVHVILAHPFSLPQIEILIFFDVMKVKTPMFFGVYYLMFYEL